MLRKKEMITAAGTLACAIGIGFIMQRSETAQMHYGPSADRVQVQQGNALDANSSKNALLDVQEITLTSAEIESSIALPDTDSEVVKTASPSSVLVDPEPSAIAPTAAPTPACEITADARPVAAAMVELSMEASCMPNERVTVHHNGMLFTETTSDTGTLVLKVPALSEEAVFILAFGNGDGAVAQTTVEGLVDYDRVVLQWKGNTGFQLHAREFGANYGTAGHIWEEAPGDIVSAVSGDHGVLTKHGDTRAAEPLLAEVYTFPKAHTAQRGSIELTVETEVTTANCGLEIEAQSLEIQTDGKVRTQNLTLAVPDCEATGSFLVLNNLLQDLKVAQR